jgi:two-component system response regulator DctR
MTNALIYLVDDDDAVRDALGSLLSSVGYRVSTHADAEAFLRAVCPVEHACIIIDIRLVGTSGLKLAERIRQLGLELPFIFLSGHADVPATVRAFKLGAIDLLQKPVAEHVLLDAIANALAHDLRTKVQAAEAAQLAARQHRLSPREREVLKGIAQGKTSRTMAEDWGVSVRTVEAQRATLFEKLEVQHVLDLAPYLPRT